MADNVRERIGKKGSSFQAFVYLPGGKRKTKTFPSERAAVRWRAGLISDIDKGKRARGSTTTVKQGGEALIKAMRSGVARTRSGTIYKPSVIRGYEDSLQLHIYPVIGSARLADVERRDVQKLADDLLAAGASASKVRNAIMPLRVIYRAAILRNDVASSPCERLALPAVEQGEIRIAAPEEARQLVDALPERDRPIWSAAFFGGLRLGELRGLEWADVDLKKHMIHVRRGWDDSEGEIAPKSKAGKRSVPMIGALHEILVAQESDPARRATTIVFPSQPKGGGAPGRFVIGRLADRARKAWLRTYECGCVSEEKKDDDVPKLCPEHAKPSLTPIGLHEARHTFASTAIAAGCNVKELSVYMGHSSITVTLDLYGHLFPGGEDEFRRRMDAHLSAARSTANTADVNA
jgi:integrase